jgi:hypothetical protein
LLIVSRNYLVASDPTKGFNAPKHRSGFFVPPFVKFSSGRAAWRPAPSPSHKTYLQVCPTHQSRPPTRKEPCPQPSLWVGPLDSSLPIRKSCRIFESMPETERHVRRRSHRRKLLWFRYPSSPLAVRRDPHEVNTSPRERSVCGWRDRPSGSQGHHATQTPNRYSTKRPVQRHILQQWQDSASCLTERSGGHAPRKPIGIPNGRCPTSSDPRPRVKARMIGVTRVFPSAREMLHHPVTTSHQHQQAHKAQFSDG